MLCTTETRLNTQTGCCIVDVLSWCRGCWLCSSL